MRRSPAALALMYLSLAALFAGFAALGTWQIHRRAWKLDLIARVEQRVHASSVAAPGRDAWARMGADDEYRRVRADGVFLRDRSVFVQAVTERGPGFWMLTPLQTRAGFIVLINRGFVEAAVDSGEPSQDPVSVSGLLRLTEPRGGFLRRNDPAAQRWYSRDVAAIAAAQQLSVQDVAPYFIDADAGTDSGAMGGMTMLRFHNNHLVYAITWYSLALMAAGAAVFLDRRRL